MTPSSDSQRLYWRSLDDRADTPACRQLRDNEFTEGASELPDPVSRRDFLSLMGASLALAGTTACRRPVETIVPYVHQPEEIIPGIPNYYASTMPFGEDAYGVVVKCNEGRPTKVEGNVLHPASLGGASAFMLASTLDLYDPDRTTKATHGGAASDLTAFSQAWTEIQKQLAADRGRGLAILAGASSSPTLSRLIDALRQVYPSARWVSYEAVNNENVYAGLQAATGRTLRPVYHYDRADVVVSLDADFMLGESNSVRHMRDFAAGRRVEQPGDAKMNRLYAVESMYSVTGAMADHRYRLRNAEIPGFAAALARSVSFHKPLTGDNGIPTGYQVDQKLLNAMTADLVAAGSRALVVAGRRQPPVVHAMVAAINEALGAVGNTVTYVEPLDVQRSDSMALQALAADLQGGSVTAIVMIGGNPLFDAPADTHFAEALEKSTATKIRLSPLADETAAVCDWHLPQSHYLEAWGDARAADGTMSVIQPMIAPLYESISDIELLNLLVTGTFTGGYALVHQTWQAHIRNDGDWRKVLHDGLLAGSAYPAADAPVNTRPFVNYLKQTGVPTATDELELVFLASPSVFDGRFANNGWLQEMPDPITKVTWDNAAIISPRTAERLGVATVSTRSGPGRVVDTVQLTVAGRAIELPVFVLPGHADDSISVELGWGRTNCGRAGTGAGVNVYPVRTLSAMHLAVGIGARRGGKTGRLACTQDSHSMHGRTIIREANFRRWNQAELEASDGHGEEQTHAAHGEHGEPRTAPAKFKDVFEPALPAHPPLSSQLWPAHDYSTGDQWGMTIDLNTCTGCSACVIACQSENNVPIIGKDEVGRGREMHWLRVDRYFRGDDQGEPQMVHQPVPCMHCENAPCEQVCPVAATVHDPQGLNVMVYNRCIGTRYCANNCPYKVRRFNFLNYTKHDHSGELFPEVRKLGHNPEVTVRSRGVMEKCSYCNHRISAARIQAKHENRQIHDGEVQTACQQACPVDAITFGDQKVQAHPTRVRQLKDTNRNYAMLGELNVRPRTTFLGKLRNPHPDLEIGAAQDD